MRLKKPEQLPNAAIVWALMIAVLAFGLFGQLGSTPQAIPYSQFQQYLDEGKIAKVTVAGDVIRGELKQKQPDGSTQFTTMRVPPDLAGDLAKHGVEFNGAATGSTLGTLLGWILPPLLFVGIW